MRGLKRTAAGVAAIALTAGILAGCGSSSTSGADTAAESVATQAAALTKAEYTAKANAICAKIDATQGSIDDADLESPEQAKAAIEADVATARAGVAELKALVPPADLQAAHDTFVSTSEESIVLFERLMTQMDSAGVTTDTAALQSDLAEAEALEAKQSAAVKQLGLSKCFTGDVDGTD
jgi:hypothetical protein